MSNIKIMDTRNMKLFDSSIWNTQQEFINLSGSGLLTNGDTNTNQAQRLAQVIPWLVKADTMTSLAVSELPFDLLDENGKIYDTSSDWQDRLGGIPIPEDMMYLLASSLCLGKAYLIPEYVSQQIVNLQYCAPHTVRPMITTAGLQNFNRTSQVGKSGLYWPSDGENDPPLGASGEMMYFWLADRDVECGPAQTYPAGAALAASGLLFAMDSTIRLMSERGFITPTILMAEGNPDPKQRKDLENDWNRFIRNFYNSVVKIFNGKTMTVQKVGAELDQIAAAYPPLSKQAIENIGTAYGIPAALFMSDMAFASEVNPMIKIWYSTSIFRKIYHTIEKTFNTQLLNRFGLRLKFKPESLDAFQAEETDRSGAWATYVGQGADPIGTAKMLGIEIPDGLTYEEVFPPKPPPAPVPVALAPFAGQNNHPAQDQPIGQAQQDQVQTNQLGMVMDAATTKALDLWRQIAVRNFKKGKPLPIDFQSALPDEISEDIVSGLKIAITEADVLKAFEVRAIMPIVNQIKRAMDWLEVHERV